MRATRPGLAARPPLRGARRSRRLQTDERGVSDTVGSLLLVAITVVMASAFAVLLFQFKGPIPTPESHLAVTLNPGTGGWGTGDESIRVTHNGGDALQASGTRIVYTVNGAPTSLTGSVALASMFSDGKLTLGETWSKTLSLASTDTVVVSVASTAGAGSALLSAASLVPGQLPVVSCAFDSTAPTVLTWTQSPTDMQTTTVGAVTITAVLTDDCSGVDQTATPQLWWRINPATSFAQVATPMTKTATNTWQGAIPAQTWATYSLQTLEYELRVMKDGNGNSGTSNRPTDVIDPFNYPNTHTDVAGVVANFANIQSGTDSAAVGTLTDAGTAIWGGATFVSQGGGSTTWLTTNNAGASDDAWVTNAGGSTRQTPKFQVPAAPFTAGTVTSVKVNLELSNSLFVDDTWAIAVCIHGGSCSANTATQVGFLHGVVAPFDTTKQFDISALNPNGAGTAYTWAQLSNLDIQIVSGKGANNNFEGTAYVDYFTIEVAYSSKAMSVQFDWTGVPAGTVGTHTLQMSYSTALDTYQVWVWNWVTSAWTNRGTLNAGSLSPFTYVLTAQEYSAGNVRTKFLDVTPTGAPIGVLTLDYARVATA